MTLKATSRQIYIKVDDIVVVPATGMLSLSLSFPLLFIFSAFSMAERIG